MTDEPAGLPPKPAGRPEYSPAWVAYIDAIWERHITRHPDGSYTYTCDDGTEWHGVPIPGPRDPDLN